MLDGERELRLGGVKQRSVLAILLLHAGETVSSDLLVDELWGDDPPADAQTALQQHVSRLRKQLEPHTVLVTRSPGYALEIDPTQLDLERFRALRERGRDELASGRPDDAARLLSEALAVWRGQALADLADERFARGVVPALEDERLAAVESRIDADLAAGRHAELVGELEGLVRLHPFRERLRAQLMLALYRSGRQSEALDAYAAARDALVSELGLEPGPELQQLQRDVLAHDESLKAPRRPAARRRRRLLALVVTAVVSVAVTALVAAVALGNGSTSSGIVGPPGGALLAIDAGSGEVQRSIPAGRTPSAVAVDPEAVWLVDADGRTLLRVVPTSRAVETLATGATPTDVTVGAGGVWVANGRRLPNAQFVGPVATGIARLDPATGTERATASLPRGGGALSNLVDNHVTTSGGAVWAIAPNYRVVRIDAVTGATTASTGGIPAASIAAGPAGVWVAGWDGAVARLDPRTARPVFRTSIDGSPGGIAVGEDAAWVTSLDGRLWRIGAGRAQTVGATQLARGVGDVAVNETGVWVANPIAGTLTHVDPETTQIVRTIELDGIPRSIAVADDTVWVALARGAAANPDADVEGVTTFQATNCERPVAGPDGAADVLITSDLPLQGGTRISAAQMTQAIEFVLREHGFRAGKRRVAFQSCDDSVASTALFDEAKCAANARGYGRNPSVVGVIGTMNSPCAVVAVPELNRAEGGPVAMVSPLNDFVGLTRPGPGVDPALPEALYPTGRRNYLRVYPTSDLEGAALALFARDVAAERVFVLDDGDPGYGGLQATAFETAAGRVGLDVVGRASWDPQAARYDVLARRVAASGPQAVYLGGLVDTNAAAVVRELRAKLGPSVTLMGPSGLTPIPLLVAKSDGAAIGMYVSVAGVLTEGLPPAGARWAKRFGATQRGVEVEPSAVYAAQAAEVLLDAIGRSDGTRASVLEELFRTDVRGGLLGSFGFDPNGDISESPVTILRVRRPGTSNSIMSAEGATIARVVRPVPSLVSGQE